MSNLSENDRQLIPFLRNLADSIESEKLLPEQIQHIGEFFMAYKFSEQTQITETEDFDSMDIVKFITLGWYVYKVLLSEQTSYEPESAVPKSVNEIE